MDSNESIREPRVRLNVSQSVKGIHSFELTVEQAKHKWTVSDPNDVSVIEDKTIGQLSLEILKDTENVYRKDGRKLAVDKTE